MLRTKYKIHDFMHRVIFCTMHDVVLNGSTMVLAREGIAPVWASIEQKRGSMVSREGYVVRELPELRSHIIIIRWRADLQITSAAWIYEALLTSPPRWFKILNSTDLNENGRFARFEVRLIEQSDKASAPVAIVPAKTLIGTPVPEGVKL